MHRIVTAQLASLLSMLLVGMFFAACRSTLSSDPPIELAPDASMETGQDRDAYQLRPNQIVQVLPKDAIRAISAPHYITASEAAADGLKDEEGVLAVDLGGERRAYPIAILSAHEIVNDTVGGRPIAVTW